MIRRFLPALRLFARSLAFSGAVCTASATLAAETEGQTIVLRHVDLVDFSEDAPLRLHDGMVIVSQGRITYAGPMSGAPSVRNARDVDATGLTAIPGLADMHVHVWDEAELGAYLAHGITTIRNMSGMPFHLDLQRRLETGQIDGPRLVTTGPILNSQGANAQINHQLVETADAARKAVADQAEAGFTRLKVYSNLKRAPYEALLDEARTRGLKITGHTPEGVRLDGMPFERPFSIGFEEILDDGFETIEHVESILWHGLADGRDDGAARALARRIAASGTAVTPTLVAHHNLVMMARTHGAYADRPGTETLNPVTQATEQEYIDVWSKQDAARHEAKDAWLSRFTRMLAEEGVTLVTGSDSGIFSNVPGISLHEELALMQRGGMSPFAVLKASTANVASVLGETGKAGCLLQGCRADIVLLGCDPLEAIACTRHVRGVLMGGRWYGPDKLAALQAAAAQPDPQRTIENLTEGMAAQGTPLDPAALGL
ncbi:amidohydrolase family protein [Novosphingobium malaysiense]|nr:amidohydrolase family protein [Novosphingobium malaysiense]